MRIHSTNMFLLLAVHCWLHLYLVLLSCLWGAPVEALWTRNLVLSTCATSTVVWLGRGVRILGVCISRILQLRCPHVWLCNNILVLFSSIGPLFSIELPHIFLVVLKWGGPRPFYSCTWSQNCLPPWWNLYPCIGVSIVLGWFFPVNSRRVLGFTWDICALRYLLAPGHQLSFLIWSICSHCFDCCSCHTCLLSLGEWVWFIYLNIRTSFMDCSGRSSWHLF